MFSVRTEPFTEEEIAGIIAYREEMLAKGLATGPIDRDLAEKAVRNVYTVNELEEPQYVLWADSPFAGAVTSALVKRFYTDSDKLQKKFLATLKGAQLKAFTAAFTEEKSLFKLVMGPLSNILTEIRATIVTDTLTDEEKAAAEQTKVIVHETNFTRPAVQALYAFLQGETSGDNEFPGLIREQLNYAVYGQHELPWLAFYTYAKELGVTYSEDNNAKLEAMMETTDLGWWFPYKGFAVITERPSSIHLDPDGRLHNEDEKAIAYPDGWGVWAWHGRRVPSWTILDPTPERIAGEENVEIRRCAIESLGWANFVEKAQLTKVDTQDDPGNPGQVIELYDVPEDLWGDRVRLIIVTNGSKERSGERRKYGLTVPVESADAVSAVAWTVGEDRESYLQTLRRT
jgi:hypothetical protein